MSKSENVLKKASPKRISPINFAILLVIITTLAVIVIPSLTSTGIALRSFFEELADPSPTDSSPTLDVITSTPKPTITPSEIPSIAPTPEIVLTVPPEFKVGPWHDSSPNCDPYPSLPDVTTITIYGVEIFNGVPPYTITFVQYDQIIATRVSPIGEKVEFINPIVVDKGWAVYVSISYHTAGQEILWTDKLTYPQDIFNSKCQP